MLGYVCTHVRKPVMMHITGTNTNIYIYTCLNIYIITINNILLITINNIYYYCLVVSSHFERIST